MPTTPKKPTKAATTGAKKSVKTPQIPYENNPFFIAANGVTLLFSLAQGVAVMLIIFSVIALFGNSFGPAEDTKSPNIAATVAGWHTGEWLAVGAALSILALAAFMIISLFTGVNAYTSAQLAKGNRVAIKTAFGVAFEKLWSFMWLQIIMIVKILLWSLLLIVPGFVMMVRYRLASVAFFDESKNLRGNAAIQESLRLTKDAWLTTFAASTLFHMLTFGVVNNLLDTATDAVLYRQLQAAGKTKPAAHWLSWVTLAVALVVFFGAIALIVLLPEIGILFAA